MQRIFVAELDDDTGPGDTISLRGDRHHYLSRVLRLQRGDRFVVLKDMAAELDSARLLRFPQSIELGQRECVVRIEEIGKEQLCGRIMTVSEPAVDPDVRLTVCLGLLRGDGFEFALQKSTELGCFDIVPLQLERCTVRLGNCRAEKRVVRWQRIVREAAEQCRRTHQPLVHPVMELGELLALLGRGHFPNGELRLVPWEKENNREPSGLLSAVENPRRAVFIVGPEGGLTESEVEQTKAAGFTTVTLGPRILRTETAAVATTTLILSKLGDVGGSAR